jgi:hypothetical protein
MPTSAILGIESILQHRGLQRTNLHTFCVSFILAYFPQPFSSCSSDSDTEGILNLLVGETGGSFYFFLSSSQV